MMNDLVIFGATGFTGRRVVEELVRGGSKYAGISWAVAGRSESKLLHLLSDVSSKTGVDLSSINVITADIGNYHSLKVMCEQARIILNCCGPYRLYGEPVVRAAIDSKTHYLDITGEEDFIGTMQMKYDEEARQAGVYIINACGFDSIPNDMGVVFLEKKFKGTLNSVESYLSISTPDKYQREVRESGVLNFGTWESVVYVCANLTDILKLRSKLLPKNFPNVKPKLHHWFPIHKYNGKWAVPLPSPDGSVVNRTQFLLHQSSHKRPVQFQPYLALPSFFNVLVLAIMVSLNGILSKFKYGRYLLLNHPKWFSFGIVSKHGPTRDVMDNTLFSLVLVGRGWQEGQDVEICEPKKTVLLKISGKDPGYGFTSLALLQSAVTILKERNKMPLTGGVLSSGAAFWDTSLVARLKKNDVTFYIVE